MKLILMKNFCFATLSMGIAMSTYAGIEQSGAVKLQGTIYSATCTLIVNDQAVVGGSPIVNMGRHSTGAFADEGSIVSGTAGNGDLKIVAEDCPDNGSIEVTFIGVADERDSTLLAIDTGPSAAKNVGIALYQGNTIVEENRIELNKTYPYNVVSGKPYEVDFRAAYISTATTVTAGIANGTVDVRLLYK